MKKIENVLLILCGVFIFSACGGAGNNVHSTKDTEIEQDTENKNITFNYFEYDEVKNKLVLLETSSNNILAQIPVKDTEIIDSYGKISDGYVVVKSTYDEDVNNSKNINGLVFSTGTTKEKSSYEYIIYDDELNEKEAIDLKSMISSDLIAEIEEYQSQAMIEPSGQKIAWSTMKGIYVLDIKSGELMMHKLEDDRFSTYEIAFVDENTLGFYRTAGEKVIDTRYGYWNLKEDKLYFSQEKDYSPSLIRVSGKYMILNDGEDPATNKSSGKVLIYDCRNNQAKVLQVDNTESTFADITNDGKYLIAYYNCNSELTKHRIRVYDVSDEKCVMEKKFKTDTGVNLYDFLNVDKDYMLIGNGKSGKVIYYAFTT